MCHFTRNFCRFSSSCTAPPLNSVAESTCVCVGASAEMGWWQGGGYSLASGGPQSVTRWHLCSPLASLPLSPFQLWQVCPPAVLTHSGWYTTAGVQGHLHPPPPPSIPPAVVIITLRGERSEKNWTESGMSWGGQRDRKTHWSIFSTYTAIFNLRNGLWFDF